MKSSSDSAEESANELKPRKWSDIEPDPSLFSQESMFLTPEPQENEKGSKRRPSPEILAKGSSVEPASGKYGKPKTPPIEPEPELSDEEKDRLNAPVLWLRRTFRVDPDVIRKAILNAFHESGKTQVQIVDMFVTFNPERDHAYLILNSKAASELLLDGTLTIYVPNPKVQSEDGDPDEEESPDEKPEDVKLWFEKADHLTPKPYQDPYTLYLWQLPQIPGAEMEAEIRRVISPWCPILDVAVDENDQGVCRGSAKVSLDCEFDTQKCCYMLSYNRMLGEDIRASFCNTDRTVVRKRSEGPEANKERHANPRPKTEKVIPKKKRAPKVKEPSKPKETGGWAVVGREGRRGK